MGFQHSVSFVAPRQTSFRLGSTRRIKGMLWEFCGKAWQGSFG
jgi:hypothetical protein